MRQATLRSYISTVIYNPVKARVLYDAIAAFGSCVVVWFVLVSFDTVVPHPLLTFLFPCLFVAACAGFGLYSRYRLAPIFVKVTAIFTATIVVALVCLLLGFPEFFIVLAAIIAFILTALPRCSFALSLGTTGKTYLQTFNQDHLPVLVVGGGGYIGSHVVEQLLKEGFSVRVFDTFQYGKKVLADLVSLYPNLELVDGDISDMYKLTLAMQGVRAVVHLAGIVGDPACAVDPVLTRHVNIISTRLLKESAKAFGVRRFVFASSCSVYGATVAQVSEISDLHPVSLYAQTKIDSEKELLTDTHDAFHPVVLRFATVFGHSRKPRFDLVANLFLAQAYVNGTITLSGKDQWRPFVHVRDVARAVVAVIKAPESVVSRQIFNVGGDQLNARIGELATLAQSLVKVSKKKKKVVITEVELKGDRRNYAVSFTKIARTLGFACETTLEEGMREMMVNWKKGVYGRAYTDPYYSNLESTKELKEAFHTGAYQASHVSIMSEVIKMDTVRRVKTRKK